MVFLCLLSSLSYLYFQLKYPSIAHDRFRNVGEIRALNVHGLCSNSEVAWITLVFMAFLLKRLWWQLRGTWWSRGTNPVSLLQQTDSRSISKPTGRRQSTSWEGWFAATWGEYMHASILSCMCEPFRNPLVRFFLFFSCRQDQLFVPFPSLLAFQPAVTGYSSAPGAFHQAAALHRPGALPPRVSLPAACHWKGTCQLDQERKSLPQVNSTVECMSYKGQRQYHVRLIAVDVVLMIIVVQKALGKGDGCGCNRYKQPQPELWPGGGLWQQWLQGLCVLLAPA